MNTLLFSESPSLVIGLILITIIAVLIFPLNWRKYIAALSAFILAFFVYFYRYPNRSTQAQQTSDDILVAPSDGKITLIEDINIDDIPCIHIAAFLSPIDVHTQYAPCDLNMISKTHRDGGFTMAFMEKSKDNEHMVNVYDTSFGKIRVIQIAGFLVRRIVSDLEPGEDATKGDKIGMIKFGSRVDLIVPRIALKGQTANVLVSIGESIIGGITPMIQYK
jgi:phosphatidylserine decarboxylase